MTPASTCFPRDFLVARLSPRFLWRRSINVSFIDWSACASVMVFGNFHRTSFLSKGYNPHVLKPLFKISGKFSEYDLNSLAKSSGKYSFGIFVTTSDSFCQFWSSLHHPAFIGTNTATFSGWKDVLHSGGAHKNTPCLFWLAPLSKSWNEAPDYPQIIICCHLVYFFVRMARNTFQTINERF